VAVGASSAAARPTITLSVSTIMAEPGRPLVWSVVPDHRYSAIPVANARVALRRSTRLRRSRLLGAANCTTIDLASLERRLLRAASTPTRKRDDGRHPDLRSSSPRLARSCLLPARRSIARGGFGAGDLVGWQSRRVSPIPKDAARRVRQTACRRVRHSGGCATATRLDVAELERLSTARMRSRTPSFVRMFDTWFFTGPSATNNARPISLFE